MTPLRIACLLTLAPLGAAAEGYPFEGNWNCQGQVFGFTAATYDNGTGPQEISKIEAEGTGFVLTIPGERYVVVSEFDGDAMIWLDWTSGERRECTRAE
jgi:hypothetical protein